MMDRQSIFFFTLLLLLSAATLFLSVPAFHGPFLLDDYPVLRGLGNGGGIDNRESVYNYLFGAGGSEWKRSFVRASFLLNAQDWPARPYGFKLLNLIFHIVNSCLVYAIVRKLFYNTKLASASFIAFIVAGLWLVNPAHITTTMYVVQRMAILSSLFSLLSLLAYINFRVAQKYSMQIIFLAASAVSAGIALLSKESAAILLLLVPVIDEWMLRNRSKRVERILWLDGAKIIAVLLFFVAFLSEALVQGYDGRVFDRWQRIAIQGEIIARYAGYNLGIGLSQSTIFHDDMEWRIVKEGVGNSWLWWLVHVTVIGLAIKKWRCWHFFSIGVIWFYLAHLIESTIVPLELMFEHRNYFASIGLFVAITGLLVRLLKLFEIRKLPVVGYGILALLVGLSLIGIAYRSLIWADSFILHEKWATDHPNSLRAQMSYGQILENDDAFQLMALNYYSRIHNDFDSAAMELARIRLSCMLDKPVESMSIAYLSSLNFTPTVIVQMKRLDELDKRPCVDGLLSDGDFTALYKAINTMPLLNSRAQYRASYLDQFADYMMHERRFVESAKAREELFELQPSVATALKFVDLLVLGENYKQAREYLAHAQRLNEAAFKPRPSIRIHISAVQRFLDEKENLRMIPQ